MSDTGLAATVGGIAGALFGAISSIVSSGWIESRKKRADHYNHLIDDIITQLGRVNELSLKYWTSADFLPLEHVAILNMRSEIYASIAEASREQITIFKETDFLTKLNTYYNAITGTGFGASTRHLPSPNVPLAANRYYTDCKSYAASCRYRWSIWHILPFVHFR